MAATASLFDNVLIAVPSGADLYSRLFVVSAYAGMTDLLLENMKSGEPGVYGHFVDDDDAEAWHTAMERVRAPMHSQFMPPADLAVRQEQPEHQQLLQVTERSETSRVGKEGVSRGKSRWRAYQ